MGTYQIHRRFFWHSGLNSGAPQSGSEWQLPPLFVVAIMHWRHWVTMNKYGQDEQWLQAPVASSNYWNQNGTCHQCLWLWWLCSEGIGSTWTVEADATLVPIWERQNWDQSGNNLLLVLDVYYHLYTHGVLWLFSLVKFKFKFIFVFISHKTIDKYKK